MTEADPEIAQGEFAYSVVREVVLQWDPYGLVGQGRPIEELQPEMRAVCQLIAKIQSPRDACYVLSRVFSAGCDESGHFSLGTCEAAGNALYERLLEAGLIGGGPPSA
jgi:hypothetical protein